MVNSFIPMSLSREASKCASIIREFTMPNEKSGPEKIIPYGIILHAKGLAVLTVVKAGFIVTARGGSGLVFARLPSGEWSAPSAIGIVGLGGGFELGAEITDFVMVLNNQQAVDAFSKGTNVTLGGNVTVAIGPYGRNVEGDVALRSTAAIFTYSRSKGLFGGLSLEGACIIERKDANRKFYGEHGLRARQILSGAVDPPDEAKALYDALADHERIANQTHIEMEQKKLQRGRPATPPSGSSSSIGHKDDDDDMSRVSGSSLGASRGYGGTLSPRAQAYRARVNSTDSSHGAKLSAERKPSNDASSSWESRRQSTGSSYSSHSTGQTPHDRLSFSSGSGVLQSQAKDRYVSSPNTLRTHSATAASFTSMKRTSQEIAPSAPKVRVKAVYAFDGVQPGDLAFNMGDTIVVTRQTESSNDWWEGELNGRRGIFPANYVKAV